MNTVQLTQRLKGTYLKINNVFLVDCIVTLIDNIQLIQKNWK